MNIIIIDSKVWQRFYSSLLTVLKELRSQLSVITVGKDHKPQLKENTIQGLFTVQTFHNQLYSNGNQLTADSDCS